MSEKLNEWGSLLHLIALLAGFPISMLIPILVFNVTYGTYNLNVFFLQFAGCVVLSFIFMTFGGFIEKRIKSVVGKLLSSLIDNLVSFAIIFTFISFWIKSPIPLILTSAASLFLFGGYSMAIRDIYDRILKD